MSHPFDEFSKSLADGKISRRESLCRLRAALAGALIAPLVLGAEMASANPDSRGRRRRAARKFPLPSGGSGRDACTSFCKKCTTKSKRDQCLNVCHACNNDPKRLNGACGNYVCCSSAKSYCSGRCIDLKTDPNNCGSCGKVCSVGTQCANGTCQEISCPSGYTKCASICVYLLNDNNNCGACGNVCGTGTSCINGTCTDNGSICPTGLTWCEPNCVDLLTDTYNCGACNIQCAQLDGCSAGTCVGTCVDC